MSAVPVSGGAGESGGVLGHIVSFDVVWICIALLVSMVEEMEYVALVPRVGCVR